MRIYSIILLLLTICLDLPAQELKICFYNVENLFDMEDNPHTNDNEFLPKGTKQWNKSKYRIKINNIGKAILAASQYNAPEIIGLAEIENLKVLEDLIFESPLKYYDYKIIHFDSKDRRGIDCAILYRHQNIRVLSDTIIRTNSNLVTRDILYSQVQFYQDTFHLFVNHWPSRYGGKSKSAPKRLEMAKLLQQNLSTGNNIIMGDFNDNATDPSLQYLVKVNLLDFVFDHYPIKHGTLKYQGKWHTYDHFIISSNLIGKTKIYDCFQIDWLLVKDEKHNGKKPLRSWQGPKYLKGFSDHLPIFMEISISK